MPPPSNFQLPDDFPDLTLPENRDPPADPQMPMLRSPQPSWKEGDRVLAPWEPHFLYVGKIAQIEGPQILVEFEDGDAGWVLVDQLRPLIVQRGQKVFCRRKIGPVFSPCEIREVNDDQVRIEFVDDQKEEWTKIAGLRIPCEPRGPAAVPVQVANHLAFLEALQVGSRVWAPWVGGTLFVGSVNRIQDKDVLIHFDDGDQGWVLKEQLAAFEVRPNMRVFARWKMGQQCYPGIISDVDGERIHVTYDDGDKEWTKPAALVFPGQRVGPDARPEKVVNRASPLSGWVVPILIGIALVAVRVGCR